MMSSALLKCLIFLKLCWLIASDPKVEASNKHLPDFHNLHYLHNFGYPIVYLPDFHKINTTFIHHDKHSSPKIPDHSVVCYLFAHKIKKYKILHHIVPKHFDPKKETKIITHGWLTSIKHVSVTLIQNAYLKKKKYNVISCDWKEIAKDVRYLSSAHATEAVGVHLGKIIQHIVDKTGTSPSKIHLIGHSLGAHVASAAGKFLNGTLGRITSLDPAGPCFEHTQPCALSNPLTSISPSDAQFVDVIHTCKGVLGLTKSVGHADFYPNGGGPVIPGCEVYGNPVVEFSCSHSRSFQYFAESITSSRFVASKCDSWTKFILKNCESDNYIMGDGAEHDYRGSFYLFTDGQMPFGLGKVE